MNRRAVPTTPRSGTRRALRVARQRLVRRGVDQVADDPEPGGPRRGDVARPVGRRRVGVVDHERLSRGEAQLEQRGLARAGAQEIHRDPYVRLQPAVAVERGLARALEPAQHDRLHGATLPPAA
jgi:hypothetical protein